MNETDHQEPAKCEYPVKLIAHVIAMLEEATRPRVLFSGDILAMAQEAVKYQNDRIKEAIELLR